jgi:hypothetical protein
MPEADLFGNETPKREGLLRGAALFEYSIKFLPVGLGIINPSIHI